jgi:hypothetical protein
VVGNGTDDVAESTCTNQNQKNPKTRAEAGTDRARAAGTVTESPGPPGRAAIKRVLRHAISCPTSYISMTTKGVINVQSDWHLDVTPPAASATPAAVPATSSEPSFFVNSFGLQSADGTRVEAYGRIHVTSLSPAITLRTDPADVFVCSMLPPPGLRLSVACGTTTRVPLSRQTQCLCLSPVLPTSSRVILSFLAPLDLPLLQSAQVRPPPP